MTGVDKNRRGDTREQSPSRSCWPCAGSPGPGRPIQPGLDIAPGREPSLTVTEGDRLPDQ